MKIMLVGGPLGGTSVDVDNPERFYQADLLPEPMLAAAFVSGNVTIVRKALYRLEHIKVGNNAMLVYAHDETLPSAREMLTELVHGYQGTTS